MLNGAEMHRKDKHGGTALDAALAHGFSDIVNFLIQSEEILEFGGSIDQMIDRHKLPN